MAPFQSFKYVLYFEAFLFIALGILAIAIPQFFTLGIELLIGSIFIAGGIFQFIRLFQVERKEGFLSTLFSGILNLVVGGLLLAYPVVGVLSLTYLLIVYFIIDGLIKIYYSFQLKPLENWGWIFISGLLSLALSALIITGLPGTAVWVIGLLVGINMLFFGGSLLAIGANLPKRLH